MAVIRVGRGERLAVVLVGSLLAGGCQSWWSAGSPSVSPQSLESADGEAVVATQRLVHSRRPLPAHVEEVEVEFAPPGSHRMEGLAGRIADLLSVNVVVEDRPARDGRSVEMMEPLGFRIAVKGTARELLDEVARKAGYAWEYDETGDAGRIVFFRHMDAAWKDRFSPPREIENDVWRIEPTRHDTVREVLEEWARAAGWTVVWEAEELDYAVTAPAVFYGTFEDAVDTLFQDTREFKALIPTAWRANRFLTVRAGG